VSRKAAGRKIMYWDQWGFFGMHYFWWMFWFVMIIVLFGWMVPVPRKTARLYREDPLGILKRRYAAGEITTAEYEERKAHLDADLPKAKLPATT
jgi:putative membrane protein